MRTSAMRTSAGDADLSEAILINARLSAAKLHRANLQGAILIGADFSGADLTGCRIHGVSAWRLKIEGIKQQNLVITRADEPTVTVDNIEVAQFVYLLLHNEKIRDIIDTIGKKGVLLLGRFTEGRMVVLERLKEKLRDLGFVPMVFNFDKPETKDFTETVRLLCKPVPLRDCRHYQPPAGTSRTASDGAGLYGPVRPHPSAGGATVLNVR